ncbi:MAG: molybdopterin-dependent oxidoreductase [Acidobacteriaceae bacterium]|nr:molybdopterin-dependent oxidoreductase [Acidobacteriaceae bacterium]
MTRRELLWLTGSGLVGGSALKASEPRNLSYPLRMIEGTVTAPNLLFIRDHFNEPDVSVGTWKLRIEGRVDRRYEFGFADLAEMPSKKVEAVLECAGNAANGSAVSNGVWEGVPMSSLLEAARPAPDAAYVLLEGADSGRLLQDGPPLPYSQLVPLDKCRDTSSLVAFKYNDLTLPKSNGFPARALFQGLYGMNSVKWLRRIVVLRAGDQGTVFDRSGMNRLYNRVTRQSGADRITRVSSVQVKSAIAWPTDGLKLPAGHYEIWGFAWSGGGAIRQLSISVDGGKQWNSGKLTSPANPYGWVRWSYEWNAKPGDYALMSRAKDATGSEQPLTRDPARKDGYELNWCMPIHCSVR